MLNVNKVRVLLRRRSVDKGISYGKRGLSIIAILAAGWVVASMISLIITSALNPSAQLAIPPPAPDRAIPAKSARTNYDVIAAKNVFGPLGQAVPVKKAEPEVKKTSLAMKLVGVMTGLGDPYAIIEDDKQKDQDAFGVGDQVFGMAKLKAIFADKVEVEYAGQIETLVLEDAPTSEGGGSIGAVANEYLVEESELNKALENLPLLLTQARAIPYYKNGQPVGLRMFAIKNGSLYSKLGFQNGDILKSINNNELTELSEAMKLFETLKQEREITVTLERGQESKEFRYKIQ